MTIHVFAAWLILMLTATILVALTSITIYNILKDKYSKKEKKA